MRTRSQLHSSSIKRRSHAAQACGSIQGLCFIRAFQIERMRLLRQKGYLILFQLPFGRTLYSAPLGIRITLPSMLNSSLIRKTARLLFSRARLRCFCSSHLILSILLLRSV